MRKCPPKLTKKRTFGSTLNGPLWGPLKTAMEANIPWYTVLVGPQYPQYPMGTRKFHQRVRRKQALSEVVYPGP